MRDVNLHDGNRTGDGIDLKAGDGGSSTNLQQPDDPTCYSNVPWNSAKLRTYIHAVACAQRKNRPTVLVALTGGFFILEVHTQQVAQARRLSSFARRRSREAMCPMRPMRPPAQRAPLPPECQGTPSRSHARSSWRPARRASQLVWVSAV